MGGPDRSLNSFGLQVTVVEIFPSPGPALVINMHLICLCTNIRYILQKIVTRESCSKSFVVFFNTDVGVQFIVSSMQMHLVMTFCSARWACCCCVSGALSSTTSTNFFASVFQRSVQATPFYVSMSR